MSCYMNSERHFALTIPNFIVTTRVKYSLLSSTTYLKTRDPLLRHRTVGRVGRGKRQRKEWVDVDPDYPSNLNLGDRLSVVYNRFSWSFSEVELPSSKNGIATESINVYKKLLVLMTNTKEGFTINALTGSLSAYCRNPQLITPKDFIVY